MWFSKGNPLKLRLCWFQFYPKSHLLLPTGDQMSCWNLVRWNKDTPSWLGWGAMSLWNVIIRVLNVTQMVCCFFSQLLRDIWTYHAWLPHDRVWQQAIAQGAVDYAMTVAKRQLAAGELKLLGWMMLIVETTVGSHLYGSRFSVCTTCAFETPHYVLQ